MFLSLSHRLKSLWWLILTLSIITHNILISVALIPANPISIRYANKSLIYSKYVAPQGWFFFTPTPKDTWALLVRYGNLVNELNEYQDPFLQEIQRHHQNYFNTAEKAVYIHMDFSKDLVLALEKSRKDNKENPFIIFKEGDIYKRVNNFIRYFANDTKFAQWKLVKFDVIPFSQRYNNNKLTQTILFESEVMSL